MKKSLLAAAAVVACLPILASAQFAKTEDAIKYRQSAMTVMGQHFYCSIGPMTNDRIPFDAATAKEDAAVIATVSKLPWKAFGPGTDKGAETRALPAVWSDSAKFTAAQKKLAGTMPKLLAAADTGDKAQIKAAVGEVGAACKGCHDDFQKR